VDPVLTGQSILGEAAVIGNPDDAHFRAAIL